MKKTQRADDHRPGIIVPADYDNLVCYSLAHSMVPAIGVDCARPYTVRDADGRTTTVTPTCPDTGRCCVRSAERACNERGDERFGSAGKCGVCGAHFVYGALFLHPKTGAVVHMGHDCAARSRGARARALR